MATGLLERILDQKAAIPNDPLLAAQPLAARLIELNKCWQAAHALFFATGGTTFIAGTAALFFPAWKEGARVSAILYTVGSCGFLAVDVQEFFTYTSDSFLRFNISLSAIGSLLYVLGSIGFFPVIFAATPVLGLTGFIGGSLFIGISQLWKTIRYLTSRGMSCTERGTAVGVELNAGIGAWCFFAGTIMFADAPRAAPAGKELVAILAIWFIGSVFFTLGAVFLAYRHAVLGIS